jgi:GntR family transcriptional regulator/MocR family aminotransferase
MRSSDLNLFLDPGHRGPLYLRVAEAVVAAIRARRILPGMALPGIREVAEQLGVHRNTALAAMRELEAQGWVTARSRSGFYVAERQAGGTGPVAMPGAGRDLGPGFEVPGRLRPITDAKGLLMDLSDGVADARLIPTEPLARAYQRALRLKGPELFQSTDFKGQARLRNALVEHLAGQRGLTLNPEQLLIIRSTSMAVSLVAQALLGSQGGNVGVENPGHPAVWKTLRQASAATLVPLRVDGQGLVVEDLEQAVATGGLRLLVLTPQCHYPTGVLLAEERRARILALAREHRFAILELDTESDLLRGEPLARRPLAASDTTGQVLYVGSLSRVFGPGLRLGYLAVPRLLADPFAKARQNMDWHGDALLEWAVSELILEGEFGRHLRRVRKAGLERREALLDALRHGFGDRLTWHADRGAMGLWVEGQRDLADPLRFEMWIRACGVKGFKFRQGSYFDLNGAPLAATRFGFSAYQPEELQRTVALMG